MDILFFTYGMNDKNKHLMPWRVLYEVVIYYQRQNMNVMLLSINHIDNDSVIEGINNFHIILKGTGNVESKINSYIEKTNPDKIVFPVTFRSLIKDYPLLRSLPEFIAYYPGAIYDLKTTLYALRKLGLRRSYQYLIESIIPSRVTSFLLNRLNVKHHITNSEYTKNYLRSIKVDGEVSSIITGSDQLVENESLDVEYNNYILFVGPPSRIRGVYELLDAFDIAASKNNNISLVCLFRSDSKLDSDRISLLIKQHPYSDRIKCVWRSVDRRTLGNYMYNARAVVMPFLLVPSEIPLAIFEALKCNTVVITTGASGTADFVQRYGLISDVGEINELAKNIIDIYENQELYDRLRLQIKNEYSFFNSWDEMCSAWERVIKNA